MKCFGIGEKRRHYHCKIVLLDDTELIQEIQDISRGQDVLDVVFKHLNLLETAYFGLRFIDSKGQPSWLDASKNVIKQMHDVNPITLYFSVKFYASDPCKLLEEITRYQFFLQVKQDILQSRLPVSFDLAAELLAYAVQSELGDYDPRQHQSSYISEFRFLPNQTPEFESKVAEIHKKLIGQVPSTAEMNFLDRVKWLDLYGADLHPVLGEDNVEYFIGLAPSGVIVLRNKSKVGNYFWTRILKIYKKGKYFMLRVVDKNNEENTYGFELPNKAACKQIWKCCSQHQAFFKLTQNSLHLNTKAAFSQRFRNSGTISSKATLNDNFRERPPPTVVRVPSRRYQRRIGQPDGADANSVAKDEAYKENGYIEVKSSILVPSIGRHGSSPNLYQTNYGLKDTQSLNERSVYSRNNNDRGLFSSSTNPSPRSVRSASYVTSHYGISSPIDYSTINSNGHIRRNSSSNSIHRYRNTRVSDNESEISKCSRSSRQSRHSQHRCRHKKMSEDSGTESDSSRKRRHRRKHKYCNNTNGSQYKLVDSEAQWRDLQRKQEDRGNQNDECYPQPNTAQNAVVRHVSGYINSGMESDSETVRNSTLNRAKKKQRSRSKSPEINRKDNRDRLAAEVKKHIEYELVDPNSLTDLEKRDIKYTKVETESRLFKIRYSPSAGRHRYKLENVLMTDSTTRAKPSIRDDNHLMKSNFDSSIDQNRSLYNSGNYQFHGNHKSQDSNTSVSSSHISNSSKLAGSDSSGQFFRATNNNYNQIHNDNYNRYEQNQWSNKQLSEFSAPSDVNDYLNKYDHNKANQSYNYSHFGDQSSRMMEDVCQNPQSPRVTFQTPPSTTYYSTDVRDTNKRNFIEDGNGNLRHPQNHLQAHEMSTEL